MNTISVAENDFYDSKDRQRKDAACNLNGISLANRLWSNFYMLTGKMLRSVAFLHCHCLPLLVSRLSDNTNH